MADFEAFLRSCVGSGALIASLCALLTIPPIVWLVVRATAKIILAMDADREWQSICAGIGAILPGLSFVAIASFGLATAWHSNCLQYVTGRALFAALLIFTLGACFRAVAIARRRARELAILRGGLAPSQRLKNVAGSLTASEVPTDVPFCAVLGIAKPKIVVSTGALSLLNDEQLASAIRHEAAHITRGDHLIGPVAAFLSDLLPLPVGALLDRYFESREFVADSRAVAHDDADSLASAILALSRMPKVPTAALGAGTVVRRLETLLSGKPPACDGRSRVLAAAGLALATAIAITPIAAAAFGLFACGAMTG